MKLFKKVIFPLKNLEIFLRHKGGVSCLVDLHFTFSLSQSICHLAKTSICHLALTVLKLSSYRWC